MEDARKAENKRKQMLTAIEAEREILRKFELEHVTLEEDEMRRKLKYEMRMRLRRIERRLQPKEKF